MTDSQGTREAPSRLTAYVAIGLALAGGKYWAVIAGLAALMVLKPPAEEFLYNPSNGETAYPSYTGWWWPLAAGCLVSVLLIVGAIMLGLRSAVGRYVIAIGCGLLIAFGISVIFVDLMFALIVGITSPFAVGTAMCALAPSTRRWCEFSPQDGADDIPVENTENATRRSTQRLRTPGIVAGVIAVAVAVFVAGGVGGAYVLVEKSSPQVTLPFDLRQAGAIAVDGAGTVYVEDVRNRRVFKLTAGSDHAAASALPGVEHIGDLAVDATGDMYVLDTSGATVPRVFKFAAGRNAQSELSFAGLMAASGIAVDGSGAVYVTDRGNHQVLKLAAGSADPATLPFTDLKYPDKVAVDSVGGVYVVDGTRVLKLAQGTNYQSVLIDGLPDIGAIAVDGKGDLYVTANKPARVLKLAAGTTAPPAEPTKLPFAHLHNVSRLAVDAAGAVYVTDWNVGTVLKLPSP